MVKILVPSATAEFDWPCAEWVNAVRSKYSVAPKLIEALDFGKTESEDVIDDPEECLRHGTVGP